MIFDERYCIILLMLFMFSFLTALIFDAQHSKSYFRHLCMIILP